ncbi:hypothetical protein GB927_025130 [Shinella sp. CPCC 100929]|uniref:Uncharacterized protein n=1 Tax=Shinella lacus TaxID=2654216 RepID=A0ABT1RDT1_9HYPH|nr:hypothetical protein [Shinella lacus]MCQ4633348.1 hypothetical protein [Shinella lacus]
MTRVHPENCVFTEALVPRYSGSAACKNGSNQTDIQQARSLGPPITDDLAALATKILASEGRFDGPNPSLTALDFRDIACVLAEISERTILRSTPANEEFEVRLAASDLPPAVIAITLSPYRATQAGKLPERLPRLPPYWDANRLPQDKS